MKIAPPSSMEDHFGDVTDMIEIGKAVSVRETISVMSPIWSESVWSTNGMRGNNPL